MKRLTMLVALMLALILGALAPSFAEGAEKKVLTVMIYMCGSNLESQYGSACVDIEEIQNSGVDAEAVNVLMLTGGSACWHTGQNADTLVIRALRYNPRSGENQWLIEETLPLRSMGDADTLADFIGWSVEKHPAQRYALILWDHGAGPLEGICLDEVNAPDRLSLKELAQALSEAPLPGKLSWIGMDACLMATAEVAKAVSPWAEYMIASQETEPADGWDYGFLKGIEADADGAATGRRVVDAYLDSQGEEAVGLTLSCLDLSRIDAVAEAMNEFFEPIGRSMDRDTFARLSTLRTQSASFGKVVRGMTADGYDLVDLGDLIAHYSAFGSHYKLVSALENAVTYRRPAEEGFSGLSVYHPLRNKAGYRYGWKQEYEALEFSSGYQKYLNSFGTLLTGRELADWSGIRLSDDGFDAAGENRYSMQLTPLQLENFASAQLIVLGSIRTGSGEEAVYDAQLSEAGAPVGDGYYYYPVLIDDVTPDESGGLSAAYTGRSLYLTDESGRAVAGPIGYQRSDDGESWYIRASYLDQSGREDAAEVVKVLYTCALDEAAGALKVINTEVYDPLTKTYTRRIAFDEADYTEMQIDRLAHAIPEGEGALPAFADWNDVYSDIEVALPLKWQLRFFDEQMSGTQLYATLQITDVQQNSYCTPLIRVENPNLYNIDILPRQIIGNGFELTLFAVQDTSPLNPGLNIGASFKNTSHQAMTCDLNSIVLNGHRRVTGRVYIDMYNVGPGQTAYDSAHLDSTQLAGLGELTELSFEVSAGLSGSSSGDKTKSVHSVQLSGCDASVTGGEAFAPLDEVVRGEQTWQLLELRRNARGGLSGALRVINDGDQDIYGSNYMVVNDRLQTDETLYFSVEPHTDVCVPFEISDSIYGHDLVVEGAQGNRYRYMGIDHLMERFGIAEVTSLKLCSEGWHTPLAEGLHFEWEEPIPIADPGEIGRWQPLGEAQSLLLDGMFTVNVDRLLAANDGVALRLLITNHSDRDLKFEIKYPELNGMKADFGSYGNRTYAVGAGATLIANVSVKRSDIEAVSEIGMCFRFDDFTTHCARILLDEAVPIGAEGGIYLSGSDLGVVPADNARTGQVKVTPESADLEGAGLRLSARLTNDSSLYSTRDVDGTAKAEITLHVENNTGDDINIVFTDFIINGTRYIDERVFTGKLSPGESGDCAVEIEAQALAGLEQISAIDCVATVQQTGDRDGSRECPVRFEVSGMPLADVVPGLTQNLGEGKAGGVSLRVVSIEETDGGELKGLLYLSNGSDMPLEKGNVYLYINGVKIGLVGAKLPAGTERIIELQCDNELDGLIRAQDFRDGEAPDMKHLLQRLGVDAVRSVGLLLSQEGAEGMVTAELNAPLPLAPWDIRDMAAPEPLLEGEVFVGATHAIMANDGLYLTLVLRNESTELKKLDIVAVDGDGRALEVYILNDDFSLVPGTVQALNARFMVDRSMVPGERLSEVSLSFAVDGELAEGATLRLDAPMTLGKVGHCSAEAFETTPAQSRRPMPAMLESLGAPGARSIYPASLAVPTGGRGTEGFDHGYAAICMRDEQYVKDETGESVKRPCLRELCRIPLTLDGERLVAPYSGMVLWDGRHAVFTRETPLDGGGTELRAEAVLFPKDRPDDAQPSGRLSERGYGVLLEGCWTVDGTGDGPAVRAGGWTLRNLDAGAEGPCDMPLARDGWSGYTEQTLYLEDGLSDVLDVNYIPDQRRMTLIPVQTLDAALAVRYEIFYADGDSRTITVDDGLAAIREAEEAGARQADNLGELEPEGGGHIPVEPGAYEVGQFRVSVSARLKLEDAEDASYDNPQEPQIRLGLCMKVENRSDSVIDAISTNLVLNGERETDTRWTALRIRPASACADTWYIDPEDLRSVGGVHRIQCTLNLCSTGNGTEIVESIPIDVALDNMDEAALWERYRAVGETDVYGITWQLLSAEVDEYGRVKGKLRAVNHTNSEWDLSGNAVLANGYRGTSVLSDIKLAPQSSSDIFYSFENYAWADCYLADADGNEARDVPQTYLILQTHGVREVTELTFVLGVSYDVHTDRMAPRQTLTFELREPLAVPPTDYQAGEEKLLMSEDGLSVWLESVLLGDETLSLALEVRNDTDSIWTLDLDHVNVNGRIVYAWCWKEYGFTTILPHTTQNACMIAYLMDAECEAGRENSDIHICFWTVEEGGEAIVYRDAHVRPEVPLAQSGDLVRAEDCEVRPATPAVAAASGLTDALCMAPVDEVRPRLLTPPIDGEKAARFESGEASVCIRQDYNEYEYPDLPCEKLTREIVTLPLERDDAGAVSAPYSGMALTFWGTPFPSRERTRDAETEISATLYLIRDYYNAYEIRDPGTDGGTPDVVPVGEPESIWYEQEQTVPAVKAGLRFRIGRESGEPVCLEQETAFTDMDTGEALDGDVTDWKYHSMMIASLWCDDDYGQVHRVCGEFGNDISYYPSLLPIETYVGGYWDDAELVIRYHLRYADGSEEILVEPY